MQTSTHASTVPFRYQGLVNVWGDAMGVEQARSRWSELVSAAEAGKITLIARDASAGFDWAALVPLSEVAEPPEACPVWALSAARPKLGDLITAAAPFTGTVCGSPQILARHRRPVAAIVAATTLVDRPHTGDRLHIEQLLEAGGTVILRHYPGQSGAMDEDGDVIQEPEEPEFTATAKDHTGAEVGYGSGPSVAEALLRLHRWGTADRQGEEIVYSTEPPF